MTIAELLKMPVGEKVSGGIVMTIKSTKSFVQLPSNYYVFSVIMIDDTGEILATIQSPTYQSFCKNDKIAIKRGEIQAVGAEGRTKVAQEGKKIFIDQFVNVSSDASQTADYTMGNYNIDSDYAVFHQNEIEGKIRHGVVCSLLRKEGWTPKTVLSAKEEIGELVKYIMEGDKK